MPSINCSKCGSPLVDCVCPRPKPDPAWHYMIPLVGDPLIVIRVPMVGQPGKRTKHVIRWKDLLSALFVVLKADHGLRRKDLLAIDPVFHPDDEVDSPRATTTRFNVEAAYAGDLSHYEAFWLYEWSDSEHKFVLVRKPRPEYLGRATATLRGHDIVLELPDRSIVKIPFQQDDRPNRLFGRQVETAVEKWHTSQQQDPSIGQKRTTWMYGLDEVARLHALCTCPDERLLTDNHLGSCPSRVRSFSLL